MVALTRSHSGRRNTTSGSISTGFKSGLIKKGKYISIYDIEASLDFLYFELSRKLER